MRIPFIFTCLLCCQIFFGQEGVLSAIGFVVNDIDRSERFYTEVIGMQPAGGFELDANWSREAGVANDQPFTVKMFRFGLGPEGIVLKLANFESPSPRPAQSSLGSAAGVNYLTLGYEDLQTVVNRVRKEQIPILGHVVRDGYQLVFIRDPDGLYLELVGPPEPLLQLD